MSVPTAIEFAHRMMTSVDSGVVVALCIWAFVAYPKGHAVRRFSLLSLVFLLIEALLGAGLVLFRLVAKNQSAGRAWYLSAHLTNTLLLLGVLTATAWAAQRNRDLVKLSLLPKRYLLALVAVVLVSVTGAVTALGDTLFPAASVVSGMRQDFSSASSFLLRLRLVHPFLAVAGAVLLLWIAVTTSRLGRDNEPMKRAASRVVSVTVFQLAIGVLNIALLAPLWMQLTHLLIADVLWITVVLLALEVSGERTVAQTREPPEARAL